MASKTAAKPLAAAKKICAKYQNDPGRMMDIVREVQAALGCVSGEAMEAIAAECGTQRVEVESVVTFYAFYHGKPKGQVVIRLCNDVVDQMHGVATTAAVFEAELGIKMGETTADGRITLEWTPCIGMSDQSPAVLINDVVVTYVSSDKAKRICAHLKNGDAPASLVRTLGDGNNAHELVKSMVVNNLRQPGPVVFGDYQPGNALRKAVAMTPQEVIRDLKTARLRGRGGAGFPAGMKWEFTRAAEGPARYILCNADEGEPGTFKDRVILTERADLLFEGMTIAGYAIGAAAGIVYLRGEYAYLKAYLDSVLAQRRQAGLLGQDVAGKPGFSFDIRVQLGAGAYICGEETALISSCEGLRGDPKNRPPFPAQKGYRGCPTSVNNVETYCCVPAIVEKGAGWFAQLGSKGSPGTKVLSISGDCAKPGVYEFPFGVKLSDVLKAVGAADAQAVQVGGPSGQLVGPDKFDRTICYDDLATGGAIVVFGPGRNLLDVAEQYLEFFIEESCGYCTPCRVGTVLMKERLARIKAGHGAASDLAYLQDLGQTMKLTSRCGLGQTAGNPVLTALANFRPLFEKAIAARKPDGFLPTFDLRAALAVPQQLAGRQSVIFPNQQ